VGLEGKRDGKILRKCVAFWSRLKGKGEMDMGIRWPPRKRPSQTVSGQRAEKKKGGEGGAGTKFFGTRKMYCTHKREFIQGRKKATGEET